MSLDFIVETSNELARQRSHRRWMLAASIVFYIAFVIAIFVVTKNRGKV